MMKLRKKNLRRRRMPKDKTIAIAFNEEVRGLSKEIYDREQCTVKEAVHRAFDILLPKYFKILEKKK